MKDLIFIAEDNDHNTSSLELLLKKCGILNPILVFTDGEHLIACLKGEGIYADRAIYPLPALLFLDLIMKKKSGLEVLAWMHSHTEFRFPVIALTRPENLNQMRHAYRLRVTSFLMYPLRDHEVVSLVCRLKLA